MNPEVILEVIGSLEKLKDVLLGAVNAVAPFVQALAPSVVQEFSSAMKDLQATIGSALIGIVQVASSVVREIGGVLLPLMQSLEPIITSAANVIGTLFVSVVRLAVVPLEALVPVLDILVGLFTEYEKVFSELIIITTAAARVLTDWIKSIFGSDASGIKDLFKGFFDVIRQCIKALITLAATLAVAAGAAGLVNRFGDALAREAAERDARAGGLKAAGTNPQITDIANIARQAQLAAFTAQGGGAGREKTDTEYLKSLADDLKKIAADNRGLKETLADWWDNQVAGPGGILGRIYKLVDQGTTYLRLVAERIFGGR